MPISVEQARECINKITEQLATARNNVYSSRVDENRFMLNLERILSGNFSNKYLGNTHTEILSHEIATQLQALEAGEMRFDKCPPSLIEARNLLKAELAELRKVLENDERSKSHFGNQANYQRLEEGLVTDRSLRKSPKQAGLSKFVEAEISTSDDRNMRVWHKAPADPDKPTIVFFRDRSDTLESSAVLEQLSQYADAGYGVIAFDSRCEGGKQQTDASALGIETMLHDDRTAMNYAIQALQIQPQALYCVGSKGGAPHAAEMAAEFQTKGLVLTAPDSRATAERSIAGPDIAGQSTVDKAKAMALNTAANATITATGGYKHQLGRFDLSQSMAAYHGQTIVVDQPKSLGVALAEKHAADVSTAKDTTRLGLFCLNLGDNLNDATLAMSAIRILLNDAEYSSHSSVDYMKLRMDFSKNVQEAAFLTQENYTKLSATFRANPEEWEIIQKLIAKSKELMKSGDSKDLKKAGAINGLINLVAENLSKKVDNKKVVVLNPDTSVKIQRYLTEHATVIGTDDTQKLTEKLEKKVIQHCEKPVVDLMDRVQKSVHEYEQTKASRVSSIVAASISPESNKLNSDLKEIFKNKKDESAEKRRGEILTCLNGIDKSGNNALLQALRNNKVIDRENKILPEFIADIPAKEEKRVTIDLNDI